jgi:hypothetical protein
VPIDISQLARPTTSEEVENNLKAIQDVLLSKEESYDVAEIPAMFRTENREIRHPLPPAIDQQPLPAQPLPFRR